MGLRAIIENDSETVSDFVAAANARFREALDISHLGHYSAAIYLIGYSAEMWKAATFVIEGRATLRPDSTQTGAGAPMAAKTFR
jgi:hypothetical protein